jgi:hypothetical protein
MTTRFLTKHARSLMALTLAMDPKMAPELRRFLRMAHDIHPDYMLIRQSGGNYNRTDDPGAWIGRVNGSHVGVMLLRDRSGEWFLNGF